MRGWTIKRWIARCALVATAMKPPLPLTSRHSAGGCRRHPLPSANEQLYKGSGNAFSRRQNQPVKGEWQVHEGLREDPG